MIPLVRRAAFSVLLALVSAAPVHPEPPGPRVLPLGPNELLYHYLTFSPDSKTLVAVSQTWREETRNYKYALVLYDAANGKEQRRVALPGNSSPNGVLVSPDGRVLAAHDWGKALFLLDPDKGTVLRELPSSDRVAEAVFSPDGKRIIARVHRPDSEFRRFDNTLLVVWEVASGKVLKRIEAGGAGEMQAFALAADGEHVLVEHHRLAGVDARGEPDVPWNAATHVWNLTTGRDLGTVGRVTEFLGGGGHATPGDNLVLAGCAGRGYCARDLCGSEHFWTPWQGRLLFGQGGRPAVGPDYRPTVPILQRNGGGRFKLLDPVSEKPLEDDDRFTMGHVHAVALSPDGTKVAAVEWGRNMAPRLLLWDVTDLAEGLRPRAPELTDEHLAELWDALLRENGATAHPAMRELAAAPARGLPLLRAKVRPLAVADAEEKQLRRWIADLDDDSFAVREAATANLERVGAAAKPLLEKALAAKPSPEAARRLKGLLETMRQPIPPEELRALRGVDVLEQIGTEEARRVLRALAAGAETASLTRAAKQALARLADEGKVPRRPE
jgi:hypothetical protein